MCVLLGCFPPFFKNACVFALLLLFCACLLPLIAFAMFGVNHGLIFPEHEPKYACIPFWLQGKLPAGRASIASAAGTAAGGRGVGRAVFPPIVVNLNSSSSELKLLRVLQTLVTLSGKDVGEGAWSVEWSGVYWECTEPRPPWLSW